MITLGLDFGTKTGWCIYDSLTPKILASGTENFAKNRNETNGALFLKFRVWLNRLLGSIPLIEIVMFEAVHPRFNYSAAITHGLIAHAQAVFEEKNFPNASVEPTELKKFATGKGNSKKDKMIEAAIPLLGRNPIDDNEADAIHIARYAAHIYSSSNKL